MPRTFAAVLLAVLALLSPGKAVAGPPEGASGKMMFDDVVDGLRKYRREEDKMNRIRLMRKLGATRDPRVAVELMDTCLDKANIQEIRLEAILTLKAYFTARDCSVDRWWKENEADLRRRARLLPR